MKVLIVDDAEINRDILSEILKDKYEVLEAENGREAINIMETSLDEISVILLDLYMPVCDGIKVLRFMEEQKWIGKVPVLIISSETSTDIEKKCFELGISDFIHKPFDYDLVSRRIDNIVNLFELRNKLEEKVENQTKAIKKQYKLLVYQSEKLKKTNNKIIEVLGSVVECRDFQDGTHVAHVRDISKIIASRVMVDYPEFGLNEEKVENISLASILHDIGKIAIPDNILLKPSKLTKDEKEYMKSHTLRGCEIIENMKGVWGKDIEKIIYDVCRNHHERYDGKGYPDGLVGDKTPIAAQIVAIADAYDELISERNYKRAYGRDEAFQMILAGDCGVFSPKILEVFRLCRKEIENVL